ncbi:MAG: sulfotransferase [Vicinamibacteria bacterium]
MHAELAKRIIPRPLQRSLRLTLSYTAHPGLAYSSIWPIGEIVAALRRPKSPSILLISLPRAGSTWVGRILGSSDESLYLDEPLTQSYLDLMGKRASFFEYDACENKVIYDRLATLAFQGVPRFIERIVPYPEQWSIFGRHVKRVVVKEINLLVLEVLMKRFRPRIVYLLRHPVAVARSFHSLGWNGDQFRERFATSTLSSLEERFRIPYGADFWEQSGALQAIVQNTTMDTMAAPADYTVVRYEDICNDPVGEFSKLFDFCELPFSSKDRQRIEDSTNEKTAYRPGGYDIARNSKEMVDRWRTDVSRENVERVRNGYFANRPLFYTNDTEW